MLITERKSHSKRATPASKKTVGRSGSAVGSAKTVKPASGVLVGFTNLYLADPMRRVAVIRKGISSSELIKTSKAMNLPQERIYQMLQLPVSSTKRKLAHKESLSPEQSERLLGLQRLIGQVEVMVAESGEPEGFDAAAWVAKWLEARSPALGDKKPAEFMDTVAGQEIVANLLAKMQSGAYA